MFRFVVRSFLFLCGCLLLLEISAWSQTLPDPGSLISEVLDSHPAVRRARLEVVAAQAQLRGSGLQPNPTLTLAATAGDPGENSNALTQAFEISGQPRLRREQAQHRLDSANLQLQAVSRQVAGAVSVDWLRLWESWHLAKLSDLRRQLMAEMVRVTRRRYEVGEIPQNESLRVELAAAEADSAWQRTLAELLGAENALDLLRGQNPEVHTLEESPFQRDVAQASEAVIPYALDSFFDGPKLDDYEAFWSLEEVLASADLHPDVEALRQEQKAALLGADLISKERAPQLALSVYRSSLLGSGSDIQQAAQLTLSWPIFDWGSIGARRDAQVARAEAQLAGIDERVLEVRREVSDLWNRWQAARSVRTILNQQAARYEELAREARIAYDLGLLSLTDVLQTESSFRTAGVDLIKAQAEVFRLELEILERTNLPWPQNLLEEQ